MDGGASSLRSYIRMDGWVNGRELFDGLDGWMVGLIASLRLVGSLGHSCLATLGTLRYVSLSLIST